MTADSPGPIQLSVGAGIPVTSIVYDEEMVGSCVFEKRCHLDAELDAWIWYGGNLPALCVEAILFLHDLLHRRDVLVYCTVFLPI